MKIVKVEIKNFRNIVDKVYEFDHNPIIFAGPNELGKSNTLNALMWAVTDMILTDKYGKGENDLDTIVPNNHIKGMHTEVSIWFESGIKFTKKYKTSFDRKKKTPNGHTTNCFINDVEQSQKMYYSELNKAFNFVPTFNCMSVKEINLFVDPLYAFMKLEPLQLRELLVGLGCSISDEEIFQKGFEDMRPYQKTYLGKWDTMRTQLKNDISLLETSITDLKAKIEVFANIEEFDQKNLDALNQRKENLIKQKFSLENTELDFSIKEIEMKIKEVKTKKDAAIQKDIANIEAELRLIEEKKQIALSKINQSKKEKTSDAYDAVKATEAEIGTTKFNLNYLQKQLAENNYSIKQMLNSAQEESKRKSDLAIKLTATSGRYYTNYYTCPNCGQSFPASQEDLERFEKEKRDDISYLKQEIENCTTKIDKLKTNVLDKDQRIKSLEESVKNVTNDLAVLEDRLISKKQELNYLENEPVDMSELKKLESDYDNLVIKKNQIYLNYSEFDKQIIELEQKKEILASNNREKIGSQLIAIESAIADVDADISAVHAQKSDWLKKQEFQNKLETVTSELNDKEALFARVNSFIQTMIREVNKKATEKTGIDFVMLEENLTNDNLKEVCYATVDGIPFASINTAKKIEVGVRFIEKLKDIAVSDFGAPRNTLPILVDRLEGIDDIEKLKDFTNEQFITTRVMFFTKQVPSLNEDGSMVKNDAGEIDFITIPDKEKNRTITVL